MLQRITPFLWFDTQAEEAAELYCSIFPDSKIISISRYPEDGPGPAGQVMVVEFELSGQRFMALNGGPQFPFTEAVSFMVHCEGQAEIDHYWSRLLEGGGEEVQCGWLKDRFGLRWQVVPNNIAELIGGPDPAASQRAVAAMMQMVKLDVAALERARAGG